MADETTTSTTTVNAPVSSEASVEDQTNHLRDLATSIIVQCEALEPQLKTPVVQEVVLARRHAEDFRMRLGVAQAKSKGLNPWVNKVEAKTDGN